MPSLGAGKPAEAEPFEDLLVVPMVFGSRRSMCTASAAFCLLLLRLSKVSDTLAHESLDLRRGLVWRRIAPKPSARQRHEPGEPLSYPSFLTCAVARKVRSRELPPHDDFNACLELECGQQKRGQGVAFDGAAQSSIPGIDLLVVSQETGRESQDGWRREQVPDRAIHGYIPLRVAAVAVRLNESANAPFTR
jgi:hypothetical protein